MWLVGPDRSGLRRLPVRGYGGAVTLRNRMVLKQSRGFLTLLAVLPVPG
jgi:hypothetical protein